jgi:hypothetical protein
MSLATDCPGLLNLASIAVSYAQLTGVLAGFAFTALVFVLTQAQQDEVGSTRAGRGRVLLAFFSAFVALVFASLMYSVLAGDTATEAHGRAAALELVDGVPFGLSAIMLFQGVTLLIQQRGMEPVVVWTGRVLTVVVAPTLTAYYIADGASDSETARAAKAGFCVHGKAPTLGVVLSLVVMAILATSLIPSIRPRVPEVWARRLQAVAPIAVLVVSIGAAVEGGTLSTEAPDFTLSSSAVSLYLVGTASLLVLLGVALSLGDRGVQQPTSSRSRPLGRQVRSRTRRRRSLLETRRRR